MIYFRSTIFSIMPKIVTDLTDDLYFTNCVMLLILLFPAVISRMTWLIAPLTDYRRFILTNVIISSTIFGVMP